MAANNILNSNNEIYLDFSKFYENTRGAQL